MNTTTAPRKLPRVIINGVPAKGFGFAFDGCHKIYICPDNKSAQKMEGMGYDLMPIDMLPDIWKIACPLKFISSADLRISYVLQGENTNFQLEVSKI